MRHVVPLAIGDRYIAQRRKRPARTLLQQPARNASSINFVRCRAWPCRVDVVVALRARLRFADALRPVLIEIL